MGDRSYLVRDDPLGVCLETCTFLFINLNIYLIRYYFIKRAICSYQFRYLLFIFIFIYFLFLLIINYHFIFLTL